MSYGPLLADMSQSREDLDQLMKLADDRMYEMKRKRDAYRR